MTVGFFRRFFSALVDFVLVFLVVYLGFILGGRTLLQNRVDYFDDRYAIYTQILNAYNDDLEELQVAYNADVAAANGDADLEAAALAEFNAKASMLRVQNTIDIEPYSESLTVYFVEIIYFFSIGLIILLTLMSSITLGKTLGRRALRLKLVIMNSSGETSTPNPIQVFFHDVVLKYFFILIVFAINMYYGALLILLSLLIDMILMSVSRNKTTIRDYFLRMRVVSADYTN